ncbi:MAG: 4Fe-4S dicluster domain-containing protein [Thermacetogeniaceae bacterium]
MDERDRVKVAEMNQMVIVIDPEKCAGCHSCEMACSMKHFQKNHPNYSRIRIQEFREVNTFIPITCQACADAACIKVCPMGARVRLASGAVVTNEDACIGCRACIYVCPYGAPVINPENGKTMTCDLCGGEETPWCVRACTMQKALMYVPKYKVSQVKGRGLAWQLKEEFKPKGVKEEGIQFGFSFG